MAKYRIIPSKYYDGDYELWHLEKKNFLGCWEYIKMDRDKNKLIKVIEFMSTPPEYHTDG